MKHTSMQLLVALILLATISGCQRFDDNLFNPNENKITHYQLDNYAGEVDFKLPESYKIPNDKVHLFTLESKAADEAKATPIYAVYIGDRQRISTDTVIMYCHGNKDHMDFYWPRAQLLANTNGKNNYGVIMIDYRGYGLSGGKPSEKALNADVATTLAWLSSQGLTGDRLVMYGFSMGSIPATHLTAEPINLKAEKLMLEAPIASAKVMVQDATGLATPAAFVTDLNIDNVEMIKKVSQPLFWIHGTKDDFLNIISHGQLIFENHKGSFKQAHKIDNAGHSNVPLEMGFQNYLQAVGDFIRR